MTQDVPRASPETVRKRVAYGDGPLLICAYEDESKCREMLIEDAITLRQLRDREADLEKDRALVFY